MEGMQWLLEIALMVLLAATLFHALRLERALGVLKRDRATLEELVAGFNDSTRQAESGIDRLRAAAEGAGRQMARQIEQATRLKEDLLFLTDRGEKLADRMDELVRLGRSAVEKARPSAPISVELRPTHLPTPAPLAPEPDPEPRVRSQAERDLLRALRMAK